MKSEKIKTGKNLLVDTVNEEVADTTLLLKKKKKTKEIDETPVAEPKTKKVKAEKDTDETADPKSQKAPKEDKTTKFMVSMKKSVRKNIKKEAAEVGISMNEYIVLAVEEKLRQNLSE